MQRYFSKDILLEEREIVSALQQWSYPLESEADLAPLFNRIGDARIVMLGGASHGTHDYYSWRNHITQRLIKEKGFHFIAAAADWSDGYAINRFVKGYDTANPNAFKVLNALDRWPNWLLANRETAQLCDWLKKHNEHLGRPKKVGLYGLDAYGLWQSMERIMAFLKTTAPAATRLAEDAFHCFEPYFNDKAGAGAAQFAPDWCATEMLQMLEDMLQNLPSCPLDPENIFCAQQQPLLQSNAGKYYRAMMQGGPHSWNVRDRHMAETLDNLLKFHGDNAKVIVWAHNTHVGDARATDMIDQGMFNLGELAKMKHQDKGVVLVGFGCNKGAVMAAPSWGAAMQSICVPEARKGSWEYLLHHAHHQNQLLLMEDLTNNDLLMENHIGHRAIGVVYNPQYEQYGNYVPTIMPLRYDAFVYLEETSALHPLRAEPVALHNHRGIHLEFDSA